MEASKVHKFTSSFALYISCFTFHALLILLLLFPVFAVADMPSELKRDLLKKALAQNLLRRPEPLKSIASITDTNQRVQLDVPKSITFGIKLLFITPIHLHQKVITHQDGDVCTFKPSCSHYGAEAIRRHGLRGLLMASDRLLRCHGGNHKYYPVINGVPYDPVSQPK